MKKTPTFRDHLVVALISLTSCWAIGQRASTAEDTVPCAVSMSQPISTADTTAVIDVVKKITRALADHDFKSMSEYLDPHCTTYDEGTHKLVVGREAVIKDVKEKVAAEEARLKVPTISFTIDHPYAQIDGDRAIVTFVLIKEIGGKEPAKFESRCSDIFVKRDGQWKKLHYCGDNWKKL